MHLTDKKELRVDADSNRRRYEVIVFAMKVIAKFVIDNN